MAADDDRKRAAIRLASFVLLGGQPNMAATETKGMGRGRGAGAGGVGRKEAESGRERVMTGRGSSHRWLRTGTRRGRDEIAPYGKRGRREREE